MEFNQENRNDRLVKAAQQQKYATFYDLHIFSPILDTESQPTRHYTEKRSENFTVRLPYWVRERLNEFSEKEAISVNQLIKNAIENAIKVHDDRAEARAIFNEKPNIVYTNETNITPSGMF